MDVATTKDEMLERVRTGWWNFQRILAEFEQKELNEQAVDGNWTAKDIIAHVAFWEEKLLGWLQEAKERTPAIPGKNLTWNDVVDSWNEETYQANRRLDVPTILAAAAEIHERLFQTLSHLPEARDHDYYGRWKDDRALWNLIAGNTYAHYDEHLPALERYLAATGKPGPVHP